MDRGAVSHGGFPAFNPLGCPRGLDAWSLGITHPRSWLLPQDGLTGKFLGDRVRELVPLAGLGTEAHFAARHQLVPIIPRVGGCTKYEDGERALRPEHDGRERCVPDQAHQAPIATPAYHHETTSKGTAESRSHSRCCSYTVYDPLGGQPRTRSAALTRSSRPPFSMWAATRHTGRPPTTDFGATDAKCRFAMLGSSHGLRAKRWCDSIAHAIPGPFHFKSTSECVRP